MTTDTEAPRAKFERQCRGLDLRRNEAGAYTDGLVYVAWVAYQQGYAAAKAEDAAAVAKERERCALVCDHFAIALDYSGNAYVRSLECARAAIAIRAGAKERGE